METNAAIIILTPILLPIVTALGINPIHFGMIMILNLAIGLITPPFGANLFMASEISRAPILLPIVTALGINPIHFGMIMILNLAIGLITPPFGANLFMASEISRVKFETFAKTI